MMRGTRVERLQSVCYGLVQYFLLAGLIRCLRGREQATWQCVQ